MLPELQSITDMFDKIPTENEIERAAALGRKLSEIYGSVSVAFLKFGEAMVQGFSLGLERAKLIDWDLVIRKSRRRAKYIRRYERIGRQRRK